MRVLHVSAYFAPAFVYGGPPRSIYGLCRALRETAVDARVVTTTANGAVDLPAAPDGTEYGGVPVRYCRRSFPRALWYAAGLRRAIRDELARADLLHLHGLWHAPGWIAAAEARRRGVPYLISPRGMLEGAARANHAWRKRLAFAAIERRQIAGAELLHATSEAEAATLESARLGPPVVLVPNGVDVPDLPQARTEGTGGPRIVLFVGRIHPIKRLDLLAAAAKRLVSSGVRIVIVGPDEGGHRASVEPLFAGLDVHWTGGVDEAERAAWLARASVLVACSDSESFGLTIAEAMAAAVPVVATRTLPWPEIETEQAGRWVPQDPAAIAVAVDGILEDRAAAQAMGGRGRELVRRRYAWEAIARAFVGHYSDVIGRRAAA